MTETINSSVFEKIHRSVDMLNSLQNCRDTFVLDREQIDERLFEELNNFESFVKQFENIFIKILMEDLKAISRAAVINSSNSGKAKELIDDIKTLIEDFSSMESDCIEKSQSLLKLANESRDKLALVKKEMELQVKQQEKHRRELDSAMIILPQANS